MKRRVRRHREPQEENAPWFMRIPAGVYWTLLALIIVVLVVSYDRRESGMAKDHVKRGQQRETEQRYDDAVIEYEQALANPRFSRREKADAAIRIANLYFEQFEDYNRAYAYYLKARRLSPQIADARRIDKQMHAARERATVQPDESLETTSSIVQRVELIAQPAADREGPVVATMRGEEIRAGELDRALRDSPAYQQAVQQGDSAAIAALTERYVQQALTYRAAVDAGFHRSADITEKLYEYQRQLISSRYVDQLKRRTATLSDSQVEQYYREHRNEYTEPARVSIAMIKTTSAELAKEALQKLRDGVSFADVATSYSKDAASVSNGGMVGYIGEGDKQIPGLGAAQALIEKLVAMEPNQVSGVSEVNGSFCVFKIVNKVARDERTLDEVRPQIESKLRSQAPKDPVGNLMAELTKKYNVKVQSDAPSLLIQFAGAAERKREAAATASATQPAAQSTTSTAAKGGERSR